MLFPIRQLIEGNDPPLCVPKTTKVREALAIMMEHDFSQLPIVDEKGLLTGIITEQSIVNTYFIVGDAGALIDLPVDHCQMTAITISPDANIFDALDMLKNTYAIVVLENQKPVGILTDYDTTHFFRNYSEGLIQVQDVEETLRQYILAILDTEDKVDAALVRTFGQDKKDFTKLAREFEELSFWETVLLITESHNWEKFEQYFNPKQVFLSFMEQVREIRNQLAHFRGELTPLQRKALKKAIDWLAARPKILKAQEPVNVTDTIKHTLYPPKDILSKGKYKPLEDWLIEEAAINKNIRMKFEDIEKILGELLPDSARKHRAWWANDYSHPEAMAWMNAGWVLDSVDINTEEVTFSQTIQTRYLVFFTDLLERLKQARPGITQAQKASLANWFSLSSGITGFTFGWVLPKEHILRTELYIDKGDKEMNKASFNTLLSLKESIESEIGEKLIWEKLEDARASRIYAAIPFKITNPLDEHEKAKSWGVAMMLKFYDTFQPRLRGL
jgi:CBS domain-containing protein